MMKKLLQKQYSPIPLLFLITLVTHGLMLLNHGHFYDGSIAFNQQKYNDILALKQINFNMGSPFTYYLHRIIWLLHGKTFIYGLISFFSIFLSSLLIYKIVQSLKIFGSQFILLFCIFVITYPGLTFSFNPAVTPLMVYLLFFLIAFDLAIMSEKYQNLTAIFLSLASLSLFFISFTLGSLLTFYLTFILILYYTFNQNQIAFSPTQMIRFVVRRIHFILLPIVFWMIKSTFFKPVGFYLNYNKLELFDWKMCYQLFSNFFNASFQPGIFWAALFCTVLILILYVIIFSKSNYLELIKQKRSYVFALLFGILAWLLAVTPYVLVGKAPLSNILPQDLYQSRYFILTAPSIALILTSLLFIFFSRNNKLSKIGQYIAFAFLLYFILFWWIAYLGWQSSVAFRQAIVQQLKSHPAWKNYSVYLIHNTFFQGYFDPFYSYEWGVMLNDAYDGNSRVGTPFGFCTIRSLYSIKGLSRQFGMSHLNIDGKKALLKVTPPKNSSDYFGAVKLGNRYLIIPTYFSIGLKYLYYDYLKPEKLTPYLKRLVRVEVTPDQHRYDCSTQSNQ